LRAASRARGSGILRVVPANAQSKTIRSTCEPEDGPLAGFGESDGSSSIRSGSLAPGLKSGGKTYPVEIISKDSQSSGTRASESPPS